MSTSCVLHPRLSNGEKSPLFFRLKEFFLGDRKLAENVYYKAINPAFREAFPNVRFDHNGEPLLEDLITQCGIGYNKDSESMLDFLNSEYGTKSVPKTIQSVIELQNRAASFNTNNPLNKRYSAQLTSSGQDISMEIVEATGEERSLGRQQRFNAELNNQLVKLLNSWGADVAALTELEEASNINGVMDLSAGINAATGLKEVIRISKRHRWSNISEKQNILSDEEQEILNNASRDSQGRLLAPNGKVSNLTEKQYAQVRTKAFKDWFGDWENNPSEASKVVDENGEPLVVYHGTTTPDITTFDLDKTQSGKAFWFANENAQKAVVYFGQNNENLILMPLFVNMKTPLLNDDDSMEPYATDEIHDGGLILGKLGYFKDIFPEEEYQELLNKGLNDNSYLATGNVTNPNQIKSATDNIGTFSRTDDNIYHANTNLITDTEIYANPIVDGATDNAYGVRLVNDMDSFVRSFPEQYRDDIEHLMARNEIEYSCM